MHEECVSLIRNKQESDFIIKKLGLNKMSEGIFSKENINELSDFLKINNYPFYNLRDKNNPSGNFFYKITPEEVLKQSKNYDIFSVYESLALADEKLILQGDIQLNKDFTLLASLSDIKNIPNRLAMQKPVYKINVDLKEKKEPSIKGLTRIIDYIITHKLFEVIVEFSLFDIPVGVNKENILIWELRNY